MSVIFEGGGRGRAIKEKLSLFCTLFSDGEVPLSSKGGGG